MKMCFRWFGETDSVKLEYIRQIPNMYSIVSAVYDVAVGEKWKDSSAGKIKDSAKANGLAFEVVESIPVHEDIKLGKQTRDKYIENYKYNIKLLAKFGVKCICYNFMPVFDWTRTQLNKINSDKSSSLAYYSDEIKGIEPQTAILSLPGWDTSYKQEELQVLLKDYSHISKEDLWNNLQYFLQQIIPVAEECDVKMAIHPDDPPFDIFSLPRIITNEQNIDRFLQLYPSKYNGLTFCTGSLGCVKSNDILKLADKYLQLGKIHFVHLRNVKLLENNSFEETAHYSECGSLDMVEFMKILYKYNYNGYIRPDHGRMIWGESGKAGYGLYDRALGSMYISGIWETLAKGGQNV